MKIVVIVTTTAAVAGMLIVGYYIYKSRTNLGNITLFAFKKQSTLDQ